MRSLQATSKGIKKTVRLLLTGIMLFTFLPARSQQTEEKDDITEDVLEVLDNLISSPLDDLVGTIMQDAGLTEPDDSETVSEELYEDTGDTIYTDTQIIVFSPHGKPIEAADESYSNESIMKIVEDYYRLEKEEEKISMDVLSYMTDIYSGHGYYDVGYWGPPVQFPAVRNINFQKSITYGSYDLAGFKGELPAWAKDDFYPPVPGVVTSLYGYRPSFGRMHHGIDIALKIGDPVYCSLPGVVTYVGYDPKGYGNYIKISHSNGLETRYAHLSATNVKAGDAVGRGQIIGLGGNTGNATGPHLHFETRFKGVALDPQTVFNFSRRSFSERK